MHFALDLAFFCHCYMNNWQFSSTSIFSYQQNKGPIRIVQQGHDRRNVIAATTSSPDLQSPLRKEHQLDFYLHWVLLLVVPSCMYSSSKIKTCFPKIYIYLTTVQKIRSSRHEAKSLLFFFNVFLTLVWHRKFMILIVSIRVRYWYYAIFILLAL